MLPRILCVLLALLPAPLMAGPTAPLLPAPTVQAISMSQRPVARRVTIPKARWGTKGGRNAWSMTVLSSLRGHASRLPDTVPADIATWCPAYPSASRENREAFWLGLVSALAKHESTYRPTAVGGGGLWYGLLQILPSTARSYGCQADSASDLKDPRLNLSCGLRIMARTVARDGVVSRNMRGVAADWGPFHSRQKREDMIAWTRAQDYCTGMSRSLRPVARPGTMDAPQLLAAGPTHRPAARPSSEIASAVPAVPSARVTALYGSEIIATSGTLERDLRNYAID